MFEKIYNDFEGELSGVNAKNMASRIFQFDRKCTFPEYGDLRMPKGWDAEEAELRIIGPESEILASYRDEPLSTYVYTFALLDR